MRRLALLAPLLVVVTFSGTAAGSIDRTPRSVVEQAIAKLRPAPDLQEFRRDRGNRVRVIMALHDPPLAAAMYARGFAGLGAKRKLNVHTALARSYMKELSAERAAIKSEGPAKHSAGKPHKRK